MSRSCGECGVGSRGALLVDVDGRTLCTSCADGVCQRCGVATESTTISGEFKCDDCKAAARSQTATRETDQEGLDTFATDGGLAAVDVEIVKPASTTTIRFVDTARAHRLITSPDEVLGAVANATDRFAMPTDTDQEVIATLHIDPSGSVHHVDFEERYVEGRPDWAHEADVQNILTIQESETRADGGQQTRETLDETHHCGTALVRVLPEDPDSTLDHSVVGCPECEVVVREERPATDGGTATHPYAPEDLGTGTVTVGADKRHQSPTMTVPSAPLRYLDTPERISVRERGGEVELVAGEGRGFADYAVSTEDYSPVAKLGARAINRLGVDKGQAVRFDRGDDAVVLTPLPAATDGGMQHPEPDTLDVVDAPDGMTCQMWTGEDEPRPCSNEAAYIFVYDSTIDGDTKPRNALACDSCFHPPVEMRTDGGDPRPDLRSRETPHEFEFEQGDHFRDHDGRVWTIQQRLCDIDAPGFEGREYVLRVPMLSDLETHQREIRISEDDLLSHFRQVDDTAHQAYCNRLEEQYREERRRDESEFRGIGHPVESDEDLEEHIERAAEVAEHLLDNVGRPAWITTDVRVRPRGGDVGE